MTKNLSSGFTLIEVLITAFVLGVVTVSLTGLSLVITRSAIESERQEVAINIATEKLENLQAVYQERGYEAVEFKDISAQGVILREETITRNNLDYVVKGYINLVDDPVNGEGQPDFKTVLYKVSWISNIGQAELASVVKVAAGVLTFAPDGAFAQSQPSAVVASIGVYTVAQGVDDACIPGTKTCQVSCPVDAPNTCPDANGNLTQPCTSLGVCAAFSACPASGKCSDVGGILPPQEPGVEMCPNGFEGQDLAAEQCSYAECNNGVDDDGDGRADLGNVNNPGDAQCLDMHVNGTDDLDNDGDGAVDEPDEFALFKVLGPCVATEESCRVSGGGWQKMGVDRPNTVWNQCGGVRSCNTDIFVKSCDADCSFVSDSDCQDKRGGIDENGDPIGICPPDSSCTLEDDPNIVNSCGGPGPNAKSVCAEGQGAACVECVASNVSRCPDTAPEICGIGAPPGGPLTCVCDYNRCAQCNAVNEIDPNCPQEGVNSKPYCYAGGACAGDDPNCGRKVCVECVRDQHCGAKYADGSKPYCVENTCSATDLHACEDLIDNDGDRKIDFDGGLTNESDPGCEDRFDDTELDPGDVPSPPAQCADGLDNDGDGKIDWGHDPGCSWQFDDLEEDPQPVPTGVAF